MKNKLRIALIALLTSQTLSAQTFLDSTVNSATKKVLFTDGFGIGSYGEAHYNQDIVDGTFQNGNADLHRIILFMGYKFNNNISFFTEIEFEHVKEVYVEQAFMNYSVNSLVNFKGGIIIIPMGYVNEFHEPTLFNGVERSTFDKYIIPSTWSEMGFGMHGIVKRANIKYQAYVVNGFNGFNGSNTISGSSGLRSARQKGAEAITSTPAFTGKLSFYGLNGLRLGLSGYYGNTETALHDGLDRNDTEMIATADSSRVGLAMVAVNAHYKYKGLELMAIGNITSISNTDQYNSFTGANIAKQIMGFYTEAAYRIKTKKGQEYPQLIPFVRYENFDTHHAVDNNIVKNDAYHKEILTTGLGYQLTPGTIFKTDFQWAKSIANPRPTNIFNLGFGYWF